MQLWQGLLERCAQADGGRGVALEAAISCNFWHCLLFFVSGDW